MPQFFHALRDTLVHVVGEDYADTFMASSGFGEAETGTVAGTDGIGREAGGAGAGLTVLNWYSMVHAIAVFSVPTTRAAPDLSGGPYRLRVRFQSLGRSEIDF